MVKIFMEITLIVKDRVVGVVVPIAVWPKLKAIVWQFCETSKYTEIKMNMNWIWVSMAIVILKVALIFIGYIQWSPVSVPQSVGIFGASETENMSVAHVDIRLYQQKLL